MQYSNFVNFSRKAAMGILGQGNGNLIQQVLGNVIHVFKKKRPPCSSIVDGRVLKMHYQWSFFIFLFGFSAVWFSWYYSNVITCVSRFNAETQVRLDYINVCLSYPYLKTGIDDRTYILFYRWIHWTLLVLACLFYIPRKISKYCDNLKLKKLIEDMAVQSYRYDHTEKELVDRASMYIAYNLRTHNGIYFKYLFCNVLSLLIDILVFYALDVLFHGRFFSYGIAIFPLNRDVYSFTDYMSRTFPPFVECEIGPTNELVNKRTEKFGCHLQIMELYEKLFLFIWFWLILLIVCTCLYLIFLGFMWLPYFRLMLLKIAKPPNAKASVTDTVMSVIKYCKIGDIYILYRLRQHCSPSMYYSLLTHLSDTETLKILVKNPDERGSYDDHKSRKSKQNKSLKGNFSNSDELFIPTKAIPNKSFLIE